MKDVWITGKGYELEFNEILLEIEQHVNLGGNVFIGTDSMLRIDGCTFASAICLHGGRGQSGGKYFYKRTIEKNKNLASLRHRISCEVERSIEVGIRVMESNPDANVEIHIDIGSTPRSKTRDLKDDLGGWALGAGFSYKIKPEAWASASVADRHTK